MQLAKADLGKQGITEPSTEQLALAVSNVQALRDQGMGWGAIANSLGLRFGAVVSAAHRADQAEKHTRRAGRSNASEDTTAGSERGVGLAMGRPFDAGNGRGDGAGHSGRSGGDGGAGGAGSGASGGGKGGGGGAGGNGSGGNASGGNSGGGKGGGKGGGHGGGAGGGKGGGKH